MRRKERATLSAMKCAKRKSDDAFDIHRQNVQKARAMARMDVYDALTRESRDVFKIRGTPGFLEPTEDQICEAVARSGGLFNRRGRLVIPNERVAIMKRERNDPRPDSLSPLKETRHD